jgi:hypothetical protein
MAPMFRHEAKFVWRIGKPEFSSRHYSGQALLLFAEKPWEKSGAKVDYVSETRLLNTAKLPFR